MRILFVTFPLASHHFQMVPLEWACRVAGHEVRVASTPSLVDTIVGSGLPAVPVGKDIDLAGISTKGRLKSWHEQERWPDDWPIHPERLDAGHHGLLENIAGLQFTMAEAMIDDLVAYAEQWRPDLVVHDAVSFAGPVVAAAVGVPNVSHLWGSPGPQRIHLRGLGTEPLPGYEALFERVGAETRSEPSAWVDPCPPGMRYPVEGAPCFGQRYIPYNGQGTIPDWLFDPPTRRRVCVTWGASTSMLLGAEMVALFRQVIDAVTAFDVEVVVAMNATLRDLAGELPEGTRPLISVPLNAVLPTCDAVVHHGGAGTTLTAVSAGIPQLGITRRPEPSINGIRLAATGAGRHLHNFEVPDGEAGVALLRNEVAALLGDPSYQDGAKRLRDAMAAQPTPMETVRALENLVPAAKHERQGER